jgi:hypothetical protein
MSPIRALADPQQGDQRSVCDEHGRQRDENAWRHGQVELRRAEKADDARHEPKDPTDSQRGARPRRGHHPFTWPPPASM